MKKTKSSVEQNVFISLESDGFWTDEVAHLNGYLNLWQFSSRCSPNNKLLNKLNSISINICEICGNSSKYLNLYEFGEEL